jgi:hypothetical protein
MDMLAIREESLCSDDHDSQIPSLYVGFKLRKRKEKRNSSHLPSVSTTLVILHSFVRALQEFLTVNRCSIFFNSTVVSLFDAAMSSRKCLSGVIPKHELLLEEVWERNLTTLEMVEQRFKIASAVRYQLLLVEKAERRNGHKTSTEQGSLFLGKRSVRITAGLLGLTAHIVVISAPQFTAQHPHST